MDPAGPRNLAFLLSLGAIPMACDKDYSGSTEDSATANASSTTASTGGTGSTGDATGSGGSTSTGGTATATGSTSGSTGDSTTGGDPGDPCVAYWTKMAECDPELFQDPSAEIAFCNQQFGWWTRFYTPSCAETYAAYFSCKGALSCAEIAAYSDACAAIADGIPEACQLVIGPICDAFGDKAATCDPQKTAAEAAYGCQTEIVLETLHYGDTCGQATEDYYACLSALSCPELADDQACLSDALCWD